MLTTEPRWGRRSFLRAAATVPLGVSLAGLPGSVGAAVGATQPVDPLGALSVHPRAEWGAAHPPAGPMRQEAPGDVRFLLVHHTASANRYAAADVPDLIRGFFRSHTGTRNWPDVAYNFFVDRHGGIWEGRAGSLGGPVIGDATGGYQGFAQLCCFIGDHQKEPPTDAAVHAMVRLLAALADRYGVDTTPGAMTGFVSRGSNRWPAGRHVTTRTVAGHRDMSQTVCPGDAAYHLVREAIPAAVTALRTMPSTTVPPAIAPTAQPTTRPSTSSTTATTAGSATGQSGTDPAVPVVAIGVGGALLGAAALLAAALRRALTRSDPG